MNARVQIVSIVALLLAPLAANADLIRYDFVGSGAGGSTGYIDFDAAGVAPGDVASSIVSWSIVWNGVTVDTSNTVDAGSRFVVDNALMYSPNESLVCFTHTGVCNFQSIGIPFISFSSGFGFWRVSGESSDSFDLLGATISGPRQSPVSVPEPGALTLFCIGVLGLGLARRNTA